MSVKSKSLDQRSRSDRRGHEISLKQVAVTGHDSRLRSPPQEQRGSGLGQRSRFGGDSGSGRRSASRAKASNKAAASSREIQRRSLGRANTPPSSSTRCGVTKAVTLLSMTARITSPGTPYGLISPDTQTLGSMMTRTGSGSAQPARRLARSPRTAASSSAATRVASSSLGALPG